MSSSVVEKVIIRLLQTNGIFYASLISQMRRIEVKGDEAKSLPTAGVTVRNGRIELYWNPQFFEQLTMEEAKAVLEHEVHHIVHLHIERKQDRDHKLWNLATDAAINQFIENLPKGCIKPETFPKEFKMPLKAAAEAYYDILSKHATHIHYSKNPDGTTHVTIKDGKGNVIGEFDIGKTDVHDKWEEADEGELSKEVVRQAIKEAVEQTERSQGNLPAGIEQEVRDLLKPPVISWRALLKRFIAAHIKSGHKMSWKRPNRRFGNEQKGKLPDRTVAITVAVDTSGSINENDFTDFIAEIKAIQACYKGSITVLECDADIQKEYKLTKYSKIDTQFKGRGGTDFRPVFKHVEETNIKTDVLVFFTDLYGSFPEKKPPYPVIWVATTSDQKVPFGILISIPEHSPEKKRY